MSTFDIPMARQLGQLQAKQGFGRDDFPMGYTFAEIQAWQRGWDEYQESKK